MTAPKNGANGQQRRKTSRERKRARILPTQMRVPKHGVGLLRVGNPGNVGGGQTAIHLLEGFSEILGLTIEEVRARLRHRSFPWSNDELARMQHVTARYLLPSKVEHSGPAGGPIPIEAVHADVSDRLRARLAQRKVKP